jgi:integrase
MRQNGGAMHQIEKLTAAKVRDAKKIALYGDGGGLYLQVHAGGSRSWIYRFQQNGKRWSHGLGGVTIGDRLSDAAAALAGARKRARLVREQLLNDVNPVLESRKARDVAKVEAAKRMSFKQCAEGFIAAKGKGWRSEKHKAQWQTTLQTYAFPVIGDLPVAAVDLPLVLKILQPIWTTIPETASRLRSRIELVLSYATTCGYRSGDNPARWRGFLSTVLAKPEDIKKPQHHPALPHAEAPQFMAELRAQGGVAARTLEFAVLTATRTKEARGARWDEIDGTVWTIPADRMKTDKEHRVPLSDRALKILHAMPRDGSGYVFPGRDAGRSIGEGAMMVLLRGMRPGLTVHGFRSTFRDWAGARTNYPREVCEMALAHRVGSQAEQAYARSDLFEKRSRLMDEWTRYCSSTPAVGAVIVPLRSA